MSSDDVRFSKSLIRNVCFSAPRDAEDREGPTGYGEGLRVLFMRDEPLEFEWARTRACLLRPKSSAFVGALSVYGAAR